MTSRSPSKPVKGQNRLVGTGVAQSSADCSAADRRRKHEDRYRPRRCGSRRLRWQQDPAESCSRETPNTCDGATLRHCVRQHEESRGRGRVRVGWQTPSHPHGHDPGKEIPVRDGQVVVDASKPGSGES